MSGRVIALSDSHGNPERLAQAIRQALKKGKIQTAVFLGDGTEDFDQVRPLLARNGIRALAVCGNNDWSSTDPQEITFEVGGTTFYGCHGHTRYVRLRLDSLCYAAQERGAQVALHGHTHVARITDFNGMPIICPGAVCERGKFSIAYADITVQAPGFVSAELVHLEEEAE